MHTIPEDQLEFLADKKHYIFDVDGCLYEIASGFIKILDKTVGDTFNYCAEIDPKREEIVNRVEEILTAKGMAGEDPFAQYPNKVFKHFITWMQAIKDVYPDNLPKYMNMVYGDGYDVMEPDNRISAAFRKAQSKGVDISFFTNGPSGKKIGEDMNAQKVLYRHGFTQDEVESYKAKTYDLFDMIDDGAGKPEPQSFVNFLQFANIENTDQAIMFDDSIKNLKTAAEFGITPVWTWTSDEEPSQEALDTAEEIGAIRVRSTGAALLKIANAI